MGLFVLDNRIWFPPATEALEDGLLAIGGDLSQERLLMAYRRGIFPWYDGDVPLWWCPDPRFVLFPCGLKVSTSMRALFKKKTFRFTTDTAFETVIRHCKNTFRPGQNGTWITDEVERAYTNLYHAGYAHSAEAWLDDEIVGGLYGIRMGNIFFGESMFSHYSNASKFAFIKYVQQLQNENVQLVDCQVYTGHLESLGARMIPRNEFLKILEENIF